MTTFVHNNGQPLVANVPNPGCCTDTRVLCENCAAAAGVTGNTEERLPHPDEVWNEAEKEAKEAREKADRSAGRLLPDKRHDADSDVLPPTSHWDTEGK